MKRVFILQSPRKHYHAQACVVWCFDARFSALLARFIKQKKWKSGEVDIIEIAGGAKGLASPASRKESDYLKDQIQKSIALHDTPRVVLMVHRECGAYGKKFSGSKKETMFYAQELAKAKRVLSRFLARRYPSVIIEKCFADFDGLFAVS